jgi:competence protein ComGC
MNVLFLLFVISILLLLIFWELSKINSRLKKALGPAQNSGNDSKRAVLP